jgi:hypothetical protein
MTLAPPCARFSTRIDSKAEYSIKGADREVPLNGRRPSVGCSSFRSGTALPTFCDPFRTGNQRPDSMVLDRVADPVALILGAPEARAIEPVLAESPSKAGPHQNPIYRLRHGDLLTSQYF